MSFGDERHPTATSIGDRFYPVYARVFDEGGRFVTRLERTLAQARIDDTVELYLSRAIGAGAVAGVCLSILGVIVGYGLFGTEFVDVGGPLGTPVSNPMVLALLEALRTPALVATTGLAFGTLGFLGGFGSLVAIPHARASARQREIDALLPDAVSFMYALSIGGLDRLEIIEAMARADDAYGEVAREFRTVHAEATALDIDYRTAIGRRARETPSDELSQFLTDLLSVVDSGGDTERFLEEKRRKHARTARQGQERTLETLELFGELYMTLSLFPLLLLIVTVVVQLLPNAAVPPEMLYLTVYALLPLIGVAFLVLISTVKHDDPGGGTLSLGTDGDRLRNGEERASSGGRPDEELAGTYAVFDRIGSREATHRALRILRRPHRFFRDNPSYTLAVTVPTALAVVAVTVASGSVPTGRAGVLERPLRTTVVYAYVPLYVVGGPLAVASEWNRRRRAAITETLSEELWKLSSANETGLTPLESIESVAETGTGKLSRELERIQAKVRYGTSLRRALVEFANAYRIPRLARTVRLIAESQAASNRISAVLRTAARTSEVHDELERERRSRTRMQVVIVIMTFLTVFAVITILETQFLDAMAGGGIATSGAPTDSASGGAVSPDALSVLLFHAVVLQAVISGMLCGYIRNADLTSGLKYALALATVALVGWAVVI
ncbi:type II secretion system F family protein [Natronococcus sp. A-GB1]|uniref:type II secretion system F family protein n=1 Tax=Natronococcus sp. A-GB1 TaxID=3037648 RepID=UPI00241C3721|nr:type II secretion system F family protein [Natronococcus sp. A-GB1]MDG5761607.1 type II secretion system F family protein [Natronococcus sp. A-GB1]